MIELIKYTIYMHYALFNFNYNKDIFYEMGLHNTSYSSTKETQVFLNSFKLLFYFGRV